MKRENLYIASKLNESIIHLTKASNALKRLPEQRQLITIHGIPQVQLTVDASLIYPIFDAELEFLEAELVKLELSK